MTLFSEIYGAYYQAVGEIIREAQKESLTDRSLREICTRYAFAESAHPIETALRNEEWQLIFSDNTTPVKNPPNMQVTLLEKRWLKAILEDPRIKLFGLRIDGLEDISPLFLPDDIVIYDRYDDGDPFDNADYIANFRLILSSVKNRIPLDLIYRSPKTQRELRFHLMPEKLEYSEKDDKFRLIASRPNGPLTVNLSRIVSVKQAPDPNFTSVLPTPPEKRSFTMLLTDERNALDRVLLHFAHYEKRAERISDKLYRITIFYDALDESELVIRVLSFGPMVKVTAPRRFTSLIKKKLMDQYNLMHPVECAILSDET